MPLRLSGSRQPMLLAESTQLTHTRRRLGIVFIKVDVARIRPGQHVFRCSLLEQRALASQRSRPFNRNLGVERAFGGYSDELHDIAIKPDVISLCFHEAGYETSHDTLWDSGW